MNQAKERRAGRIRRHARVRRRITGTSERPRLSVFRSARNISAQLIDDTLGRTLVACSTLSPEVREGLGNGSNAAAAEVVGRSLAEKAVAAGFQRAVLDRGGYLYHGRVQALADAARKAGLDLGPAREPKNKGKRAQAGAVAAEAKGKGESKKKGKRPEAAAAPEAKGKGESKKGKGAPVVEAPAEAKGKGESKKSKKEPA